MDNEIQVGEYVRTKDGTIDKIKRLECIILNKDITGEKHLYSYTDIVKHSPNIIDLIEEGDYVNGDEVNMLTEIGGEKVVVCNDYNFDDSAIIYNNKRIKTIVTKEQFKAMEYEVGGKDE